MNKPVLKKAMSLLIASSVLLGIGISVMADEHDEEQPEDVDIVETETVIVKDEATANGVNKKGDSNDWRQSGGKWYYYDTDGVMATGWKLIRNEWYYFDSDGVMVSGWKQIDGKWYYFHSSGYMAEKWQQIDNKWYYFDTSGIMATGSKIINGKTYHFDEQLGYLTDLITDPTDNSDGKWRWDSGKWYYYDSNGVMITGWKQINGKWYYFGLSGPDQGMVTGWLTFTNYTPDCRDDYYRYTYYFGSDGAMVTGWKQIEGEWFFFDQSGVMGTGWYNLESNWYYFSPGDLNIREGTMVKAWNKIDDKWYFFDDSGVMVKGSRIINGVTYHFDDQLGYLTDPQSPTDPAKEQITYQWKNIDGKWYYYYRNSTSEGVVTGWHIAGDNWYYFEQSGSMKTGWHLSGYNWYYFDQSGVMKTGWVQSGGKWYYFDDDSGVMVKRERIINGKIYEFDYKNGYMIDTGIRGWYQTWINNKWYYYDSDGGMFTGWHQIDGKWYYFKTNTSHDSGAMVQNTSLKLSDGTYDFDNSGICTNPYNPR